MGMGVGVGMGMGVGMGGLASPRVRPSRPSAAIKDSPKVIKVAINADAEGEGEGEGEGAVGPVLDLGHAIRPSPVPVHATIATTPNGLSNGLHNGLSNGLGLFDGDGDGEAGSRPPMPMTMTMPAIVRRMASDASLSPDDAGGETYFSPLPLCPRCARDPRGPRAKTREEGRQLSAGVGGRTHSTSTSALGR